MHHDANFDRALAIAELVDHRPAQLELIEGTLVATAGAGERTGWYDLLSATDLGEEACGNLVRQLEDGGALERAIDRGSVRENAYTVAPRRAREVCAVTRTAIDVLEAQRRRSAGETTAEPLVTFPDDPAFADVTPAQFGMTQLMSTLASAVKRADHSITLIAPFFEGEGLDHLADVLLDALDRGVDLTVVTRYLRDPDAHNHAVISALMDRARERDVAARITLVDYTVWGDDVPQAERRQAGPNPAFTLHAKIMLFDTDAAYIGSANVTDYGFDRYLELGVLLRGPTVRRFDQLRSFLLQSDAATTVSL